MEYLKQLIANGADAEKVWAEFESIATELDECLCRRVPQHVAHRFSVAVSVLRAFEPATTRFGAFQVLLRLVLRLAQRPEGVAILVGRATINARLPELNAADTEDCLCEKLSEEDAAAFVEAVMRVRAARPDATAYGVFVTLLYFGLTFVDDPANVRSMLAKRRGASGITSQDVDTPAKVRRAPGRKSQIGVR